MAGEKKTDKGIITHEHTNTHTQDNYRNPRCACVPRVNNEQDYTMMYDVI